MISVRKEILSSQYNWSEFYCLLKKKRMTLASAHNRDTVPLSWHGCSPENWNRPFASIFGKSENSSLLKMVVSSSWKSILNVGNLFSTAYIKSSDCNGRRKLEGFIWEKQLWPPSHAWMIFHTNPCKFRNFQTVVKSCIAIAAMAATTIAGIELFPSQGPQRS